MRRWPWLMLAAALLFSSHGNFLNDEDDQASAFWNLSHGSLRVEEYPAHLYIEGEVDEPITLPRYEGADVPIGSTSLNVLGLPVAAALLALDAVIPLWLAFSFVACAAVWRGVGLDWPWRRPTRWDRTVSTLTAALLLSVATLGFRQTGPDLNLYYAFTALQLVSLLCWALTGFLMWKLLERHLPPAGRAVVVTASLLGPMLFWGQAMKYHMLTALLLTLLLWLRSLPRTRKTDFGTGAVAALTFWTNLGPGVVAVLAIALVEVPRLVARRRAWRSVLMQWATILLGFAVGLTPFFAENAYLTGNPFLSARLGGGQVADQATDGGGAGDGGVFAVLVGSLKAIPALVLGFIRWEGPRDFLADLGSILTFGKRVEGQPLGILFVAPWLAAAAVGAYRVMRATERGPAARLALAMLVSYTVLLTQVATSQGFSIDVRFWLASLPAFTLLAAIGIAPLLAPLREIDLPPVCRWTLVTVATVYGAIMLLVAAGFQLGPINKSHTQTFLLLVNAAVVSIALGTVVMGTSGHSRARASAPVVTAVAILVPLLVWSVMYLLVVHKEIPDREGHPGASMFVPALDPFTQWLNDHVLRPSPQPIVYDGDGNLFFHPDYGRCDADPNPCPEELRRAPWANETATASSAAP